MTVSDNNWPTFRKTVNDLMAAMMHQKWVERELQVVTETLEEAILSTKSKEKIFKEEIQKAAHAGIPVERILEEVEHAGSLIDEMEDPSE